MRRSIFSETSGIYFIVLKDDSIKFILYISLTGTFGMVQFLKSVVKYSCSSSVTLLYVYIYTRIHYHTVYYYHTSVESPPRHCHQTQVWFGVRFHTIYIDFNYFLQSHFLRLPIFLSFFFFTTITVDIINYKKNHYINDETRTFSC